MTFVAFPSVISKQTAYIVPRLAATSRIIGFSPGDLLYSIWEQSS